MVALLIGYARVSTDQQDLTAQRDGLAALGVAANRVYVDQGLTGTNTERPGLREALAACREGDTHSTPPTPATPCPRTNRAMPADPGANRWSRKEAPARAWGVGRRGTDQRARRRTLGGLP